MHSPIRILIAIWLLWLFILLGYQSAVAARLSLQKPDTVLHWTAGQTLGKGTSSYLKEPFMNSQVAWDSEFYLSIALQGYDDPAIRTIPAQPDALPPFRRPLSLNYAFFPVYPMLIRLVSFPLRILRLNAIATATLAGVLISALGTLAAMLALWNLARQELGDEGGIRAAFYLITFPMGFFLTQVYTEGLFVGLSFGSLALLNRKQWSGAGLLATIATMTRAVGIFLVIPLALAWLKEFGQSRSSSRFGDRRLVAQGLLVILPVLTLLAWKRSFWGVAFSLVEKHYFNCQPLVLTKAWFAWRDAFLSLFGSNPQTAVYFAIELAAVLLGLIACWQTWQRYPGITLYGLAVIGVSMTCGIAQGMPRYVLAVPSIFLVLSRWGAQVVCDRAWTLLSILLLGMLATLFTFNMWVG
ncbi:glycosyltransferase family 39 protein [Kovacikia minuta CCNUW1]|uniref:mannosyltransferase family protein n=1 Tax=Kovacikia minuta TaxID=2931930 RepID=UPI001CCA3B47|nr:mannosyltransferase family protein [Kovacikia minuta]UBF27050.1 glycosyltransferase family 39 protein [Kovacikia minuta CCNUW1]